MADIGFDFSRYLSWETPKLLEQLAHVCGAIAEMSQLLSEAKSSELEQKARGYTASIGGTVRDREFAGKYEALTATRTVLETEARLVSLQEEKSFLTLLLEQRRAIIS